MEYDTADTRQSIRNHNWLGANLHGMSIHKYIQYRLHMSIHMSTHECGLGWGANLHGIRDLEPQRVAGLQQTAQSQDSGGHLQCT